MKQLTSKSTLINDASYVYAGYFLRYLSVIILVPYYGRVLGPESYGKVLASMSLMGIIWMFVNYGFSATGSRELAAEEYISRGIVLGRHIAARLLLIPIGIGIGLTGTMLSPALSGEPWYGILATILGIFNAMNLGWYFQGLRMFRTSIALEAMSYPLNVIFILALVRDSSDGIYAILSLLASTIVCTILSYFVVLRNLNNSQIVFRGGFNEIKNSTIVFLQSVNSIIMTSGSTYLLSVLSTAEQVGYFGSVERLLSVGLSFLTPAAQVLTPTITHRTRHSPEQVPLLIRKGFIFECTYGIIACIVSIIIAPYAIPIIFGVKFLGSIPIMQIMAFVFPFSAITHALGFYILLPRKMEKYLVMSVTSGNIFSLFLIMLLVTRFDARGVAFARVGGEALILLVMIYLIRRRYFGKTFFNFSYAINGAYKTNTLEARPQTSLLSKLKLLWIKSFRPQKSFIWRLKFEIIYQYRKILGLNKRSRVENMIVSLTSFPERFKHLHIVIKSIISNNVRPKKIVLYLSTAEMSGYTVPRSLLNLQDSGFEIKYVSSGYGCYSKLIHALTDFPNDNILTIDDDYMYAHDFLSHFIPYLGVNAVKVISGNGKLIQLNNTEIPYSKWTQQISGESKNGIVLGYTGVLYKAGAFSELVFNADLFMSLCPHVDDIWFTICAKMNGNSSISFSGIDANRNKPIHFRGVRRLMDLNLAGRFEIELKNVLSYFDKSVIFE